jgi:UTP--glucose-1-phosphate uridylyltransferase
MLQRALVELVRGNVLDIALIASPTKPLVVESALQIATEVGCQLTVLSQFKPTGVGDALLLAEEFLAGEPFIFFMPDEICFCSVSPVGQLTEAYEHYQQAVLALTQIPPHWSQYFQSTGRVAVSPLADGTYRIVQLGDKSRDRFPSQSSLKGAGIGVLDSEFMGLARQQRAKFSGSGEFDDVPVWQELVARQRLLGVVANGLVVDAGNPLGFAAANRYWLEQELA